jgi:predicted AlkP superfamily pyrophosphatase or phosphodiesterase
MTGRRRGRQYGESNDVSYPVSPMPMSKLITFALIACATLTACASDKSIAPVSGTSSLPSVQRVVVISVDGLRGDALQYMPATSALRERALWSDSMQTVVPSLTVPGHLAMFTGRDVTKFGITTNTLDQAAGLALVFNNATTMFQWVKSKGGTSAALVGSSLVAPADLEQARTFFGIDEVHSVTANLDTLRVGAIALATQPNAPTLLFVHVPTVDFAGHSFGWIRTDASPAASGDVLGIEYLAAVRAADGVVDAIWKALSQAVDAGDVALIVTADHGGGHGEGCVAGMPASREHCTQQAADRTIPFLLLAKGVAGKRLAGRPSIIQIAPSLAKMLGAAPPIGAGVPLDQ